MQKVNVEKLLLDHAGLIVKREEHLAEIEKQATLYAIERGYDEAKTEQFVAFTKELEGDGLSAEDKAKLEILESYIEEVEDSVEEAEIDGEVSKTDAEEAFVTGTTSAFI